MKGFIERNIGLIGREMDYWKAPGLAVSIVQRGEEAELAGFGWRDREKALKVDGDTLFGVGSCSEAMTAAMIGVLCRKGALDPDVSLRQYVPQFQLSAHETIGAVTLRDILYRGTFHAELSNGDLVHRMAGYIAECATKKSWSALMQELLFQPLGMNRTCCTAAEFKADENRAAPYQAGDGALRALGSLDAETADGAPDFSIWFGPARPFDPAGPATSVSSTARDMAKWLQFHLEGGTTPQGRKLIAEDLLRDMRGGRTGYAEPFGTEEGFFSCGGSVLGWEVGNYRGRPFQRHAARMGGYSCIQAWLPKEGIGAVMMMNSDSPSMAMFYTILYTIFDQFLGLPDVGWAQRFHPERPIGSKMDFH